jgi:hypothetical protein
MDAEKEKEDSNERKSSNESIYDWEAYHKSRNTPITDLLNVALKFPEKNTKMIDFSNPDLFDSKLLYRELSGLPLEMLDKFSAGLNWLHHHKIKVALIGGTAVVNYLTKDRTLTPDIDFRVANQAEFISHLDDYNLAYKPLLDSKQKQIGVQVSAWNMDFLFAEPNLMKFHRAIFENKRMTNIGGLAFQIISPELLCIGKQYVGRNKDLEDAIKLLQNGGLNKAKYLELLNGFEDIFDEIDSMRGMADMIR